MYNVLEKLRSGEPLTAKEKAIHEQGLVSVLKQLHDDLDAAVFEAYGWQDLLPSARPAPLRETISATILTRLVALNAARAAEEAAGTIRWLRPDYQSDGVTVQQFDGLAALPSNASTVRPSDRPTVRPSDRPTVRPLPWPSSLPEQVRVLRGALETAAAPVTADTLTARFKRAQTDRVAELLETLVIVGQARKLPDGRYTGKV